MGKGLSVQVYKGQASPQRIHYVLNVVPSPYMSYVGVFPLYINFYNFVASD